MNNSTQKSIKRLSIATLIIGGLTLVYLYWEMIARFIGLTALFILCWVFLHRTNQGLANGEIFPKSNISLIRWSALVAGILAFVHSNYAAVVKGESEFSLDSNTILVPLIVLLFAGLYKMAYLTAKDSNLAI